MKSKEDGTEVEWLTLEVNLGDWWSATEKINGTDQAVADPQLHWGTISKIAQCDIVEAICFKTSGGKDRLTDYFATMSFDFKRKLDSAFGTLGETAYFVQGMFALLYNFELKLTLYIICRQKPVQGGLQESVHQQPVPRRSGLPLSGHCHLHDSSRLYELQLDCHLL